MALVSTLLAPLVPLALLAGLTACGGSDEGPDQATVGTGDAVTFEFSGQAATVGTETIPAATIEEALDAFRASPAALQAAFGETSLDQDGSDQPKANIVASVLSTEISASVILAEVKARGLTVTDGARNVAATQIKATFNATLDSQAAFRDALADRYANYVTLDEALAGRPSEADIKARYDADPSVYDEACAGHVLVKTEAEAIDLAAQLRAGADFAALATAKSADPGSAAQGGSLGCQSRGMFVEAFEKAVWDGPVGQLQGPIKTEFGYHLIQVERRGPRAFDVAHDDVAQDLAPDPFAALGAWLGEKLSATDITVDARFGTWDSTTGQVTPVGVSASTLPLSSAGSTGSTGSPGSPGK
ncbi:MAG: peptidylprolyl isomerase [Acidimicrobiales bacterium]